MSINGAVVVGEYRGRPVSSIQEHHFHDQAGRLVIKTRYVYADKLTDKGKPEKTFRWPKDTDLTALHLYGWDSLTLIKPGDPIILVEGETNVDAAFTRGFFAVCTPQPVGPCISCLQELASYPQNPILISADNDWDGGGVKKALVWYEFLSPIHPDVRWMPQAHPSDGGDLKDLLDSFDPDDDKGARAAVQALVKRATIAPPFIKPTTSVDKGKLTFPSFEDFNDLADEPDEEMVSFGLFTEGTWIIAGAPKLGKSWFCLSYAHGLAMGGAVLGELPVEQSDVLAFVLEDGRRRYKQRIKRRVEELERPPRGTFNIAFSWPRLDDDDESIGRIESMIAMRTAAGRRVCVIIDTGTKLRPLDDTRGNVYMGDYNFLDPITQIAQKYHCLILVVAHTRKAPSDDFIDSVIGSHGISGAVDGIAVLSRDRHSKQATLEWTSRDGEEGKRFLKWDATSDGWLLTDEPDTATENRRAANAMITQIIQCIINNPNPAASMSLNELQVAMKKRKQDLITTLAIALEDGRLDVTGTGTRGDPLRYSVPGTDSEPRN